MAAAIGQPAGSMSPSTSPRFPSPPPYPEVQNPPKSPLSSNDEAPGSPEVPMTNGISRRIRPGTKASDIMTGPPLVPLSQLDSPFQLQEYLRALYASVTTEISASDTAHTIPVNRSTALLLAVPPKGVDRSLWLYELCRLLVMKANSLIVMFFADNPPCSAQNCPEMRASEWQYLCAVHDPPKSCCAIDYCCHTLDWAANILTSPKHFPSRTMLSEGAGAGAGGPGMATASQQGIRQLTNVFRRVYRMFAHAWFQHREVFWSLENQEGLYLLYKTVCDVYHLMPEDTYTVPPEAEGLTEESTEESVKTSRELEPTMPVGRTLLRSERTVLGPSSGLGDEAEDGDKTGISPVVSTGATTKRHKHTPSTGSFVPTITEGDEEAEEQEQKQEQEKEGEEEETPADEAEMTNTVRFDPVSLPPAKEKAQIKEEVHAEAEKEPTSAEQILEEAQPEQQSQPVKSLNVDEIVDNSESSSIEHEAKSVVKLDNGHEDAEEEPAVVAVPSKTDILDRRENDEPITSDGSAPETVKTEEEVKEAQHDESQSATEAPGDVGGGVAESD